MPPARGAPIVVASDEERILLGNLRLLAIPQRAKDADFQEASFRAANPRALQAIMYHGMLVNRGSKYTNKVSGRV
jgi:hypothetical protein